MADSRPGDVVAAESFRVEPLPPPPTEEERRRQRVAELLKNSTVTFALNRLLAANDKVAEVVAQKEQLRPPEKPTKGEDLIFRARIVAAVLSAMEPNGSGEPSDPRLVRATEVLDERLLRMEQPSVWIPISPFFGETKTAGAA